MKDNNYDCLKEVVVSNAECHLIMRLLIVRMLVTPNHPFFGLNSKSLKARFSHPLIIDILHGQFHTVVEGVLRRRVQARLLEEAMKKGRS